MGFAIVFTYNVRVQAFSSLKRTGSEQADTIICDWFTEEQETE